MGSEGLIEKYINPYTDFGFKKLFGTELNKDLLISFLNSLLPDGQVIKDVTYLNAEQLGTLEADRRAVFDVYCENEQGEKFLVEMQKGEQQFFKDRSIFYTTFPIREQAMKGRSWNYELKAVYTVGILNFAFDNKNNDYFHHEVKLVDMGSQEVFYDKLTLIYLEMPKFNKTEHELENMFDKWMFVLRNLSRLMERPAALQERIFTRLFEAAEIARFNRQELVEYEDSLKNFRDWYSVMETSLNKGRAEGLAEGIEKGLAEGLEKGLAEGLEKGRTEGVLEVARKMKSNSIPLQTIQELTGLSLGEIEKL
ncbi:Rpn family recombination-promoting nuclease/putative transposase [Bacteroides sp. 224]|uniref:Rpn family recombination-promoting nuclease/putative transposase n=1 Tax=Bacteroides sp. 224 TaxID=2302936 RepID=UPI0013D110D5|nr:Rpn family recombination-promoting nuclease/putative transposase [Bacteroides sp. 224]NDV66457.1 Rpn family recombination-promoting nuclease/putative transposase [Bacteroides sp. 224]